jgi:hypothetical protein
LKKDLSVEHFEGNDLYRPYIHHIGVRTLVLSYIAAATLPYNLLQIVVVIHMLKLQCRTILIEDENNPYHFGNQLLCPYSRRIVSPYNLTATHQYFPVVELKEIRHQALATSRCGEG